MRLIVGETFWETVKILSSLLEKFNLDNDSPWLSLPKHDDITSVTFNK